MTDMQFTEKLFAFNRLTNERLADFFKAGGFDGFSIKPNEFEVFCAFWVTASSLLHGGEAVDRDGVENFNRSVIVILLDRIMADRSRALNEDEIAALNDTVTDVFMERYTAYHGLFQADLSEREEGRGVRFPRLVEGFLNNVLDKPLPPDHSGARQLLAATLDELLTKSQTFFAG